MRIFYPSMACFLHVFLSGCMDYIKVEEDSSLDDRYHFPPVIDAEHISPLPSRLINEIIVGKNCRGQVFTVPPIEDRNKKDRLYYLWFLDNELIWRQFFIEPESRDSAILTLTIDEQFLLSHLKQTKIPRDFFNRRHIIDFFVSDVEYTIPETRRTKNSKAKENEHSAHIYWIVTFSDQPCV